MLTIFSVPKAFSGPIGVIERNAVRSWLKLEPACQIILLGDDEGVAETAADLIVHHVPQVARTDRGTPLLNSAFELAQRLSIHDLMLYVNCDIILMSDFMAAVRRLKNRSFLMVGQRWDVKIDDLWDFDNPEWEARLRDYLTHNAVLHPPSGSDYFLFRKGSLGDLPAFRVGRVGWDNWLIYYARKLGLPVIDASRSITIAHQNHEPNRACTKEEADQNLELAGGWPHVFTLSHATHVLTSTGLQRPPTREWLHQEWYSLPVLHPRLARLWRIAESLRQPYGTMMAVYLHLRRKMKF